MNIKDLVKSKMRSSDYKLIYDGLDGTTSDNPVLIYASKGVRDSGDTINGFYPKFHSLLLKLGYKLMKERDYSASRKAWCERRMYKFQYDSRPDMPEEIMFSVATPPYTDPPYYTDMFPISSMINIAFFWYDID